jgi:DNA-binding NtrC family response regulator
VKSQLEALVGQMHGSGILYSEAVREFKKCYITDVLERNSGNQCKAARELGMHRNTLSRTIAELELDLSQVRAMRRPPASARPLEMPAVEREQAMEKKAAR